MRKARSNRGMALIAVLWIVSLLALMAAGIGSSTRTVTNVAYNRVENAKARLAADAGVQRAIFDLLVDGGDRYWRWGGSVDQKIGFDETQVSIRVRDEDGKIDINVAPIGLIAGVFAALGLDETLASSLATRIGDYRDEDSIAGALGAEDPDYQAAGYFEGAADRPFRNISELRKVLGLSDTVYAKLRPHVTTYSDAQGIDPSRASAAVLEALPGMTPEALDSILSTQAVSSDGDPFSMLSAERAESIGENLTSADPLAALPTGLIEALDEYLLPSRELIYEIQTIGESAGGGRFMRNAVISLEGHLDDRPFTVHDWQPGAP